MRWRRRNAQIVPAPMRIPQMRTMGLASALSARVQVRSGRRRIAAGERMDQSAGMSRLNGAALPPAARTRIAYSAATDDMVREYAKAPLMRGGGEGYSTERRREV